VRENAEVFIVEDDPSIRSIIEIALEGEGAIPFRSFAEGDVAWRQIASAPPKLVILDLMLPGLGGLEICRRIRSDRNLAKTAVIMLTALGSEEDVVAGFEAGADDYVTKPFSPKEVMARINAVTKRRVAQPTGNEILKFEGLEIDMAGRNVYVDGVKAELTPKEYELLFYLVRNKGIALSREKLLYDVWGFDFYGDDRTVDTHIKMLRSNLKEYRKFVVTLRGMGYKFEV
jgi:DNA-binding response OmpR family regulator